MSLSTALPMDKGVLNVDLSRRRALSTQKWLCQNKKAYSTTKEEFNLQAATELKKIKKKRLERPLADQACSEPQYVVA